jgi:putative tryptophan/tyrosine transport system substrate-binding protein
MRRREFITLLGGAAAAWPLAARAQQPMPVIGLLGSTASSEYAFAVAAFKQGLNEVGFVEGLNVAIEYRWAEGQYGTLQTLAADLVERRVTLIVALGGSTAALAAKAATSEIPIIFNIGADPVDAGLVTSLARPGGNVTGVAMIGGELFAKRLELLRELLPQASLIAVLVNPADPKAMPEARDMQKTAVVLGRQIQVLTASSDADFDAAFAALSQQQIDALVVGNDGFFNSRRARIVSLAARHAIPAIYPWRTFVEAGGLISYGANLANAYREAGIYAGKILKEAKPADLPVIRPTKFELVINLKTAKALGLTLPPTLLARADEVIE